MIVTATFISREKKYRNFPQEHVPMPGIVFAGLCTVHHVLDHMWTKSLRRALLDVDQSNTSLAMEFVSSELLRTEKDNLLTK